MRSTLPLVLLLPALWIARPVAAQTVITEFPLPTVAAEPAMIARGPDGNLWFTESKANKIGVITPQGLFQEFAIPTPGSTPSAITAGPDGNLWFIEFSSHKIGKITPTGIITEFALPDTPIAGLGLQPNGIVTGPDGNLWFTESAFGKIGRITPAGAVTEFRLPPQASGIGRLAGLTAGPDGALWFTKSNGIGRISTSGVITEFPLIIGIRIENLLLGAIALGADGNLWAGTLSGTIWKINPAGTVLASYFTSSDGTGLAPGADGAIWFTTAYANKIGRITPSGAVTEYRIPTAAAWATSIAPGPDGNLWFVEQDANKIAKLVLATVPTEPLLTLSASSLTFNGPPPPNQGAPAQILTVTAPPAASYQVGSSVVLSSGLAWLNISPTGPSTGSGTFNVSLDLKPTFFGTPGIYTGDITFASATVTQHVAVTLNLVAPPANPGPQPQTIRSGIPASVPFQYAPFFLDISSTSGLQVFAAGTTPAVCSVNGPTITLLALGNCSLTLTQPGNASYQPATLTVKVLVTRGAQAIIFFPLTNTVYGARIGLPALSTAGLPQSYAISGPATYDGTYLSFTGLGSVTIQASQAGSANFFPAAPVTHTLQVTLGFPLVRALLNAASYTNHVAPGAYATLFGASFYDRELAADPADLIVRIRDARGTQARATLSYAGFGQINLFIPTVLAPGPATLTITNSFSDSAPFALTLAAIAPALFSADSLGTGVAAAQALVVGANGERQLLPVATCGSAPAGTPACKPVPMARPAAGAQLYLILHGTGIRAATQTSVTLGGISAPVLFAGPQGEYPGLDQVNVQVPDALARRGLVEVRLSGDAIAANPVTVEFQ
jgi:uncharacterized protein (TIGR03437 family)